MPKDTNKQDVSIVIPCYLEEGHILDSTREIYKVMNGTNYSFEIIFVEDAGSDTTREKILQIAKEFPDVKYLFHTKNTGKGMSIADGAKIANGKYIGHLDIDLEVSAEYLPKILAAMEEGCDIAIIKRKIYFSITPQYIIRDIAGVIYRLLVKHLLRTPYMDVQSGCKFFKRDTLLSLIKQIESKGWFFDTALLARAYYCNCQIQQIPGYYIRNKKKKSTVKLFADGTKQLKELFAFRKMMMSKTGKS